MPKLLDALSEAEAEILAILAPLYAEVQHWEAELGNARKAKRAAASGIEARKRPDPQGLDPKGESPVAATSGETPDLSTEPPAE